MKRFFTLAAAALLAASSAYAAWVPAFSDDFNSGTTLSGWGGTFGNVGGAATLTHSSVGNPWDAQASISLGDIPAVGTQAKLTIKAKASAAYNLAIGFQNPNGYVGCGDFEQLALTTEYQEFEKTVEVSGENAQRMLINFGSFDGTIYIDEMTLSFDQEVDERNHVLKITTVKKSNSWDSQVQFKLTGLEAGQPYTVSMQMKTEAAATFGTEFIQNGSDCKDQWGNSALFEYTATLEPTDEWSVVSAGCSGFVGNPDKCGTHDEVHNFAYTPNCFFFNCGQYGGTILIDNFEVKDAQGNVVCSDGYELSLNNVSKPSWHSHVTIERVIDESVPGGETAAPVLQASNPMPNTTVNEIPDVIILMFDQEITSVEAAALQSGYNDPMMIEESNISILDGNSVYLNVADIKSNVEPGNVTVYAMVNGLETPYELNFTYGAAFEVASSTFTSKGGQLTFSDNVDFYDYATEAEANVLSAETQELVTTATLTLDDDDYTAINVEFAESLDNGSYILRVPGETIVSTKSDVFAGGDIEFAVSDATGISSISADSRSTIMYNVMGQRVNRNIKGFAIQNGKVIVNN